VLVNQMQTIYYVHAQVMPGTFALSFFFDGIANLINCEGIRRESIWKIAEIFSCNEILVLLLIMVAIFNLYK